MDPLPAASAAVILGSGLAVVPHGATVRQRIPYDELGWPVTDVEGHPSELTVVALTEGPVVLLAGGRPHRYEGWSDAELERPARDLITAGIRRLLLVCACGGLRDGLRRGDLCLPAQVVDLQRRPRAEPDRLLLADWAAVSAGAQCATAALKPSDTERRPVAGAGAYASVLGPQFETPAEAAWLAGFADVVGMSAAPEARAGLALGAQVRLLAVVTNASGASLGHAEVLAAGAQLAERLACVLSALVTCPELWK